MLSTVAVLSDIHGVLPALEAVLAEPDVQAAERIVVTGDLVAGPQPKPVLAALRALGEQVLLVRGNADREMVALARHDDLEAPDDVSVWAAAQLDVDEVAFLAGLAHPILTEVSGFGTTVFCHGTPRSDDEVVLVDSSIDQWADAFTDLSADIRTVVCGHTHMPFVRLVDTRLVINAGSVGMPYGRAGGNWALLHDGQVSLRHTAFDVDDAVARVIDGSSYPERAEWANYFVRASASDAEALAAFTPRVGRFSPPDDPNVSSP